MEVGDLIGHPEGRREFFGRHPVSLRLGDSSVKGTMEVEGWARGTVDGVSAQFTVTAPIHLTCVRCLREWDERLEAAGSQHFTRTPDEDGYSIEEGRIDVVGPATDELALAIPVAPLCRPGCKGLCPICGTDLNDDPCDGHGDDSDSPFAVLRDLFDS